jgi:hypothetical protein
MKEVNGKICLLCCQVLHLYVHPEKSVVGKSRVHKIGNTIRQLTLTKPAMSTNSICMPIIFSVFAIRANSCDANANIILYQRHGTLID